MDRLLVISDIGPTQKFTGGLVLSNLARSIANQFELDWLILHEESLGDYQLDSFSQDTTFTWTKKPAENWSGVSLPAINKIGEKFSDHDFREIWKKIEPMISEKQPSQILVVLQGQTSFKVALNLHESKISFSSISWDPWIWWSFDKKVNRAFTKKVETVYRLLNTGSHLVPTNEFAQRYQIPSENVVVLYPHVPLPNVQACSEKDSSNHPQISSGLNLCFAGQIYAKDEFKAIISELDKLQWKINNLNIQLHYFGGSEVEESSHVINHGWIEPSTLVGVLSKMDIGILAYPSETQLPEVSALSFPSKYATYCAAGIPTIYIGPENSPVAKMIEEDSIWKSSSSSYSFRDALIHYLHNYEVIREKSSTRYQNFFSAEAFSRKVSNALAIEGGYSNGDLFRATKLLSKTERIENRNISFTFLSLISIQKQLQLCLRLIRSFKRRVKTILFFITMLSKSFFS